MGVGQGCFGYYSGNQKLVKKCVLELYKYSRFTLLEE